MKFILFYAAVACSILTSGCTPSPDNTVTPVVIPPPTTAVEFKCKIGSASFDGSVNKFAAIQSGRLSITGVAPNNEIVMMQIPCPTGIISKGTYTLVGGSSIGTYTVSGLSFSTSATTGASPGTLVITSVDTTSKKISGTFSYTATDSSWGQSGDTKGITNGVFNNIPYSTTNVVVTTNAGTMSVNGTALTLTTKACQINALNKISIALAKTTSTNNQQTNLSLSPTIVPGTYNFSGSAAGIQYMEGPSSSTVFYGAPSATNPSLTITTHDLTNKHIIGSFSAPNMTPTLGGTGTTRSLAGTFDMYYQ